MRIELVAFAVLKDILPGDQFSMEIPTGITAGEFMELLASEYPDAGEILKVTRLAHADEYVRKDSMLSEGEEYCLIPPVSGG